MAKEAQWKSQRFRLRAVIGEHEFTAVRHQGQRTPVDNRTLRVRLRPGAAGRLEIDMKRFVHRPSYAFPSDWGQSALSH